MSRSSIYISIVMWAVLGLLSLVAAWQMVMLVYPEWHLAARAAAGILAFNMVYWLRAFARRRGWAIASYAPGESGRQ